MIYLQALVTLFLYVLRCFFTMPRNTCSREDLVNELAVMLANQRSPHPLRVAITGVDGAGKTTLANELAAVLHSLGRPVIRTSIDNFYRPGHLHRAVAGTYNPETYYNEAFDFQTFVNRLLQPLGIDGTRRIQLASWDVMRDLAVPEQILTVESDAIILVDGVFLLHPDLNVHWDFVLWLEIDIATALNRVVKRDLVWASADEVKRRYEARMFPAHELYVRRTGGASIADAVIDNTDPDAPFFTRRFDDVCAPFLKERSSALPEAAGRQDSLDWMSAKYFVHSWLTAWNSHDLERILAHYDPKICFTSPYVARHADPSGTLVGLTALRSYLAGELTRYPEVSFECLRLYAEKDQLILTYRVMSYVLTETMRLSGGRIVHSVVQREHSVPSEPPISAPGGVQ